MVGTGVALRDALPHVMYGADLRPNDLNLQMFAAVIAAGCHRRDEALRYAKRANELITPEATSRNPGGVSWIQCFLINEPYERGDLETTLTALDRFAQTVDARNGTERDVYSVRAAYGYLRFGRLQTAAEFAHKNIQGNGPIIRALIALTNDDKDKLKKFSLQHLSSEAMNRMDALPVLIRAGLFAEAQKLISNPALKDEGFLKGTRVRSH